MIQEMAPHSLSMEIEEDATAQQSPYEELGKEHLSIPNT